MLFWIDHPSFFYLNSLSAKQKPTFLLILTFSLQPQAWNENIRLKFEWTLSWRKPLSYRNQSIDLRSKNQKKTKNHSLPVDYKGAAYKKAFKTKIKLTIHSFFHHSKWLAFFLISCTRSYVSVHCTSLLNS